MSAELSAAGGATVSQSQSLSTDPPAMADSALATELQRIAPGTAQVFVVANAYTVCVFQRTTDATPWVPVAAGEFGDETRRAIRPLLPRRLFWTQVKSDPIRTDPAVLPPVLATAAVLDAWLRTAASVTSGRQGEVTAAIKDELSYLAGWRCQFSGCGKDLRTHQATGARGRFSYFAHIVAASADGPRGDPVLSPRLADQPTNFMLLCDECHRMIDKVRPSAFSADMLNTMREENIGEVKRLLDSLQYPSAEIVAVIGNLANQVGQFSMDDGHAALRSARLRSNQGIPQRFFNLGDQHHNVHSNAYWAAFFEVLRPDLVTLQTRLNGVRTGTSRSRLAIFPHHTTSLLVLMGRVLGDTSGVHIFQPHRNQPDGVSRWAWPKDETAPPDNKYKMEILKDLTDQEDVANLVVGLTYDVPPERMPATSAANGQFLLPTIRITGTTFDANCIKHPDDLTQLRKIVEQAIQTLQDQWRVRRVHLFICSPASACVVVGQKMQARHHAEYVLHEATPGQHQSIYNPTISITSLNVTTQVAGQVHTASL